ncbi:MAG: recombinase [Firmicutes bacterium]|nr:recombinase [Bacillota bacterium]
MGKQYILQLLVSSSYSVDAKALSQSPDSEKWIDHEKLLQHYKQSCVLRNHSENTIYKAIRVLNGFADAVNKYWWEVRIEDVNAFHQALVDKGLAISTRRGYLNIISKFYAFLLAHPEIPQTALEMKDGKPVERIDWKYGIKLIQPVDPWFKPLHVSDDIAIDRVIPTVEDLRNFFCFVRNYAEDATKPLVFQRDYAMFRLIYDTGIRMNECRMLDVQDLFFNHETIHVRFGKGTKGSGRRERYVPIVLHGISQILDIYLKYCRAQFSCADREPALFLSERGERVSLATIKQRLFALQNLARDNGISFRQFSCHDLRRAFATHLYERDPRKVESIRYMLGHSMLATTQRYIRPSAKFFEEQLKNLTTGHLTHLLEGN